MSKTQYTPEMRNLMREILRHQLITWDLMRQLEITLEDHEPLVTCMDVSDEAVEAIATGLDSPCDALSADDATVDLWLAEVVAAEFEEDAADE